MNGCPPHDTHLAPLSHAVTAWAAYDVLHRLSYSCLSPRPLREKADPLPVEHFKANAPLL